MVSQWESQWWNYFYKNGTLYRNDKTHFTAWCRVCVHQTAAGIEEQQIQDFNKGTLELMKSHEVIQRRSMSMICQLWQMMLIVQWSLVAVMANQDHLALQMASKVDQMLWHLSRCRNIGSDLQFKARTAISDWSTQKNARQELWNQARLINGPQLSPVSWQSSSSTILSNLEFDSSTIQQFFFSETLPSTQSWTDEQQTRFAADLCCLLVACNTA